MKLTTHMQRETIIILNGKIPVAKLVAVDKVSHQRPAVGTVTSNPVKYSDDTFAPMTNEELAEWGL